MRKLIYLLSMLILTSTVLAQTGNIRGFIYDKSSGEPIMFCSVFLKGTTIGAATDVNGMYNISQVKASNYTLMVTYIGYDTSSVIISSLGAVFRICSCGISGKKKVLNTINIIAINAKPISEFLSYCFIVELAYFFFIQASINPQKSGWGLATVLLYSG